MPYDTRISTSHHLQDSHHRQRSRRRIAAVSFLSNISLDGTHNDTNLHCVSSKNFRSSIIENPESALETSIKAANDVIDNKKSVPVRKITLPPKSSLISDNMVENVNSSKDNDLSETSNDILQPTRKNSKFLVEKLHNPNAFITLESFDKQLMSNNKNKKQEASNQIEEKNSIAKNVMSKVKTLRSKTISTVGVLNEKDNLSILRFEKDKLSQNSSKSSLAYIDADKSIEYNYSSDRLPAATALSKLSIDSVDSITSFNRDGKQLKSSQNALSSEHLRKRTSSGSRHLTTIADGSDSTVDQTSHVTSGSSTTKVQEVSYSHLLVPSPYFGNHLTLFGKPAQIATNAQHAAVSRCFSHDPNMHGQHPQVEPPRTTHTVPTMCQSASCTTGNLNCFSIPNYIMSPELLNDPLLKSGKHRKAFEICSYITSIVEFAKPDESKKEMNDDFRKKFPHVRITLSKLRSIKREMVSISRSMELSSNSQLQTLCYAHAYFDCLCLNGKVEKTNRKGLAGACLMISAKMNDMKGEELEEFVEKIENGFRVDRYDLVSSEISALLALQFNIHLPITRINTHLQRLLFEL